MKQLLFIILLSLIFMVKAFSQTLDDIGKIILGVKITPECTAETRLVETVLTNRLRVLITNTGYSAYGIENLFNLVPNIVVDDCSVAEGGMKNVYLLSATLFLTVQEETSAVVYSSCYYPLKGYGTSKEKALKDALSNLVLNDCTFLQEAKTKILSYYQDKQSVISKQAENFVRNGQYDAAITCLLSIPEELSSCYAQALEQANCVYEMRVKAENTARAHENSRHNDVLLQKARGLLATHQPVKAMETLWDIRPGNTRQDSIVSVLQRQIESQVTFEERERLRLSERKYRDQKLREEREAKAMEREQTHRMSLDNQAIALLRQQSSDAYNLETQRIAAIKSVALEYIKNNNNPKTQEK